MMSGTGLPSIRRVARSQVSGFPGVTVDAHEGAATRLARRSFVVLSYCVEAEGRQGLNVRGVAAALRHPRRSLQQRQFRHQCVPLCVGEPPPRQPSVSLAE